MQLKLLVDENISPLTVKFLREKGFNVLSIEESYKSIPDEEIADIANGECQDYQWIKDIDHEGHLVNVLSCYETKKNKAPKKFVWITNLNITEKNCFIIGNEGGRNRWKIENQGLGKSFPKSYPCCFIFFSNYFYLIF